MNGFDSFWDGRNWETGHRGNEQRLKRDWYDMAWYCGQRLARRSEQSAWVSGRFREKD